MISPGKPEFETRCARCSAEFRCGMQAGERECWCASLPPLAPLPGRECLCRKCLELELRALG
ncbi:MAG TPA: cysteine-rich CWC family protein [Burkholderiales bacterium]|nr:cysteine-rich CWC family protein [Burkholderiales bacterium]